MLWGGGTGEDLVAFFLFFLLFFQEFLDKFRLAVELGFGTGDKVLGFAGAALATELAGKGADVGLDKVGWRGELVRWLIG